MDNTGRPTAGKGEISEMETLDEKCARYAYGNIRNALIKLYREMADHTASICANKCRNRFSCCNKVHCEAAEKYAKERYGVELQRTNHPDLPFMGKTGCVVPPHMRPVCTLHTCSVSQVGFEPFDSAWNEKYFRLRAEIKSLEKQ